MRAIVLLVFFFLLLSFPVMAKTETYHYLGSQAVASSDEDFVVEYHYVDRMGTETNTQNLPFGQVILKGDRMGFTGKEEDLGSGLQYFGARYYDSSTGRFVSVDPVANNPAYTYVNNNPMNYVDPSGAIPKEDIPLTTPGEIDDLVFTIHFSNGEIPLNPNGYSVDRFKLPEVLLTNLFNLPKVSMKITQDNAPSLAQHILTKLLLFYDKKFFESSRESIDVLLKHIQEFRMSTEDGEGYYLRLDEPITIKVPLPLGLSASLSLPQSLSITMLDNFRTYSLENDIRTHVLRVDEGSMDFRFSSVSSILTGLAGRKGPPLKEATYVVSLNGIYAAYFDSEGKPLLREITDEFTGSSPSVLDGNGVVHALSSLDSSYREAYLQGLNAIQSDLSE